MSLQTGHTGWFGRQSFFSQLIVFALILFAALLIGHVTVDYLLGENLFFQKSANELLKFLGARWVSALGMSAVIIYLRANRKRNQTDNAS